MATLELSLNTSLFKLFPLKAIGALRLIVAPLYFKFLKLLVIMLFPMDLSVMFLQFGNSFVFHDDFLIVTPALSWGPVGKILGEAFKDFASSKLKQFYFLL